MLRRELAEAYGFLTWAGESFERLLPHATISRWTESHETKKTARWGSSSRREIKVCIDLRRFGGRSVHAVVTRRRAPKGVGNVKRTLDDREFALCELIAEKATQTLGSQEVCGSPRTLSAVKARFDEEVVAQHLATFHGLTVGLADVFESLRTLAAQTYENRSIALGCILDADDPGTGDLSFPGDFVEMKKFKALTDGFRTAFVLSRAGKLRRLIDLERSDRDLRTSDYQYFPEWAADMARLSRGRRCGLALTRAGDILVFDKGSLRFTYRFGKWRYLNHAHIVNLLRNLARVQNVALRRIGAVAKSVYRLALDVSFRRTGGLIVVLGAERNLHRLVRDGDAVRDPGRSARDIALDGSLPGTSISGIPRRVLAEIASLDGAIVFANSGKLLAYSAILRPRKQGKIRGAEGSRTRAATGASMYGLTLKVSSDGGIEVLVQGKASASSVTPNVLVIT